MDNPWLRREAGEGWREEGADQRLLGMLAMREEVVSIIAERSQEQGVHFPVDKEAEKTHQLTDELYLRISKQIEAYKLGHNIGSPPPLPPAEQ